MKNFIKLISLVLFLSTLSSCSAIAGIFKAGVGVGIFVVVVIIIIIVAIVIGASKK
ncbi:MAG TPA: phosphatidate cytidylyltransferase [Bacteroidia bacterium]|nr:phosphatidate cytidylyltransferase [Bacteroidia bacterium]